MNDRIAPVKYVTPPTARQPGRGPGGHQDPMTDYAIRWPPDDGVTRHTGARYMFA
jgi:hypothetical protein